MNDHRRPTISGFIADRSTLPNALQFQPTATQTYRRRLRRPLSQATFRFVSKGYCPNPSSCNSVISYFCKAGRVIDAEKLLNKMPLFGSIPDIVSYNCVIDGWCRFGDIVRASLVMGSLRDGVVRPDLVTFNSMLNYFCKTRMKDEAFV